MCNKNTFNLLKTSHKYIQLNFMSRKKASKHLFITVTFLLPPSRNSRSYQSLQLHLTLFLPTIILYIYTLSHYWNWENFMSNIHEIFHVGPHLERLKAENYFTKGNWDVKLLSEHRRKFTPSKGPEQCLCISSDSGNLKIGFNNEFYDPLFIHWSCHSAVFLPYPQHFSNKDQETRL